MAAPRILAFAGSTRTASYNKLLVRVAAEGARKAGAEVSLIDLRDLPLPLFDEDLEQRDGLPDNAKRFKQLLMEHQGLLIACPEYNSSISAVLKNAIDWASRAEPGEKPLQCFDGKVCGLMAASPGNLGGLRGLVTVRSILGNIRVLVLPDQVAVPAAHQAFDETGALIDAKRAAAVEALGGKVAAMVAKLYA